MLCDILDCQPNDLLEPVAEQAEQTRTNTDDTPDRAEGRKIGDLRPVRARVRRPPEG